MKLVLLCLLPIVLFSCSESDNRGRIEALKTLETFARSESSRGQEKLTDIEWMSLEVPGEYRTQSKLIMLKNHMIQADSLSMKLIDRLNELRCKVIGKQIGQTEKKNVPIELDYSSTNQFQDDTFLSEEEAKKLIEEIEEFRNMLCEKVTTSQLFSKSEQYPYYFKAPKISFYNNEKEKHRIIKEELKKSEINGDDVNTIFQIMDVLTKNESTWMALLSDEQDWIDYSMSLLSIQQHIFEARWRALTDISLRIAYCSTFEFTDIEPVVVGPSIGFVGDTVQLEVFLAAYHRLKEQEASISTNGKLLKFEDGKAFFEVVLPKSGDLKLNGALTNMTKSGKRYPREWTHTIKVMEVE